MVESGLRLPAISSSQGVQTISNCYSGQQPEPARKDSPAVDNKMIFDVLGPMAHEVVGALLMLVGGIASYYLTKNEDPKP